MASVGRLRHLQPGAGPPRLGWSVYKAHAWSPGNVALHVEVKLSVRTMAPRISREYCLTARYAPSAQTSDLHPQGARVSAQVAPRLHSHGLDPSSPKAPPILFSQPTPSSSDRLSIDITTTLKHSPSWDGSAGVSFVKVGHHLHYNYNF